MKYFSCIWGWKINIKKSFKNFVFENWNELRNRSISQKEMELYQLFSGLQYSIFIQLIQPEYSHLLLDKPLNYCLSYDYACRNCSLLVLIAISSLLEILSFNAFDETTE